MPGTHSEENRTWGCQLLICVNLVSPFLSLSHSLSGSFDVIISDAEIEPHTSSATHLLLQLVARIPFGYSTGPHVSPLDWRGSFSPSPFSVVLLLWVGGYYISDLDDVRVFGSRRCSPGAQQLYYYYHYYVDQGMVYGTRASFGHIHLQCYVYDRRQVNIYCWCRRSPS